MNSRDTRTVIKLLFFSRRLILATTQPNAQDSSSTMTVTVSSSTSPPIRRAAVQPTVSQYTANAGSSTTADYIAPIR